ncbi:MAG TPA: SIS domain-containing protein [Prolixibacteraceae bacterium]|nr:SIS domain-containing protein [Prolixibacteraceae bacterium]
MISKRITESIQIKEEILKDESLLNEIQKIIGAITETYQQGGKVLFCGNGGSAADAQHLAAELSGKFYINRDPLEAEACHVNTSFLTAVANDFGYQKAYARYVKSTGKKGDVLVGLSTSGNSENILEAIKVAQTIGMKIVAFTGKSGGKMKEFADFLINIPSNDTPRIQEAHILIGHIICEMVEKNIFDDEK